MNLNRYFASVLFLFLAFFLLLPGCKMAPESDYIEYSRHIKSFFDTFDTLVQVVAYTKNEQEFELYVERIHTRFQQLHKLYDRYNNYEGINNIKTINDHAGLEPVKVEKEIIDLLVFAKKWHGLTAGRTNIALGPVLEIWHNYRLDGIAVPEEAKLPPPHILREAAKKTDLEKVIIDTAQGTVFLAEEGMSLDVGAIAKGFATELVAREMMAEGLVSGIISAGGNIRAIGAPLDGIRKRWGIGVQNPDASIVSGHEELLDILFVSNASVVSSGDYQRYYIVDGEVIHHLIDPETLLPARHCRSVTVVTEDAGVADFLSTELFLLPQLESKKLAESLAGVEAIWVMQDGTIQVTDGMKKMLRSFGVSNEVRD